jgi:transcription elongation factor Elf1
MSGQLTCGNCGHSWWSNASSARSRCGACRSVVYVPAHVREGASSAYQEAYDGEDDTSPYSGATVLVVIGFVVILVVAGVIWLRRNNVASGLGPGHELTVGAMTRWSCGHEATLSRPLDPGVTVATAPCPFCGHPGIVGQYVGARFIPLG